MITDIRETIVIMRPSRFCPAPWINKVNMPGIISPALTPWIIRKAIRLLMFQAAPASMEPNKNNARENIQVCFAQKDEVQKDGVTAEVWEDVE